MLLSQVAHLAEHRKAVNQVVIAGNGAFFVSASSDETVKACLAAEICALTCQAPCSGTAAQPDRVQQNPKTLKVMNCILVHNSMSSDASCVVSACSVDVRCSSGDIVCKAAKAL